MMLFILPLLILYGVLQRYFIEVLSVPGLWVNAGAQLSG